MDLNPKGMEAQDPATFPIPILLVSRGLFHPHLLARLACRRALERIPGVRITSAPTLRGLANRDLSPYRAIVLYFHEKTIARADLDCLRAYVAVGGGLVAIHSAAASYKQQPAFADLLGGRFSLHGPVARFSVRPSTACGLPGAPLRPFAILDERYRHQMVADVTMDFVSTAGDQPEPFAWRRMFGSGRVFYLAAGHTLAGLSHPSIQSILAAGLHWAAKATL
jgi:type 1 glutamine amidotransferase